MTISEFLKELFPTRNYIARAISKDRQQLYNLRSELLWDKIYNSTASGISQQKYCDQELIVSLTTYGKRIYEAPLAIESIMQGSIKPNRIVLWLDHSFENKTLPLSLQNQQKRGLEINYCDDILSYKKLIPTLKKYPEAAIITIDDDLLYAHDLVENLLRSYLDNPDIIHASRMHRMTFKKDGSLEFYRKWDWQVNDDIITPLNFFTSGAGTLFPPHCFDVEVFNEEVFLGISHYSDDVWFNAMALKKGTKVKKSFTHNNKGIDYLVNQSVQDTGLMNINYLQSKRNHPSLNDIQLNAVFDKYKLFEKLK